MRDSSATCLRIGLTGGIASGKSLVADLFVNHGVPVIDTDILAREAVQPGSIGLHEVTTCFGTDILTNTGQLDRASLRQRVFEDSTARAKLENILHPIIRAATLKRLQSIDHPYVIIAVPLLLESGFTDLIDRVLVVDCPVADQKKRLIQRDGGDIKSAEQIINAQASRSERLKIANDIIINDQGIDHVQSQVNALHEQYLALTNS